MKGICVLLEEDVASALKRRAKDERRSMRSVAAIIIERALGFPATEGATAQSEEVQS